MADEFNAALDIPYVFEISINDFAALWRKLERRSFALKALLPNWYGQLQGEFAASFGALDAYVGHGSAVIPRNGMEKAAVEAVIATMLMGRLGMAIRELAVEAGQAATQEGAPIKGRLHYGKDNRIIGVDNEYLRRVLDPAEDYQAAGCVFEVLGYSPSSPFSMTSRIASMMLLFNRGMAPLNGRPVEYNVILKTMHAFIAAENLGYVMTFEHRNTNDDLSIFTTNEFNKLTIQSAEGDLRLIQKYLKAIGFYFGDVDNALGPEFEVAARNFARVYRLDHYAHYSDRDFLYTLANAYVLHRSQMSTGAR
ncbi:hypothetical protein IB270_02330 [Ensifer sp. ENS05]|uniref:peptidoglycan-binding domain-containing protein n=1 Tax=Ensifer sp. ENS05 TaxID=2769277 RepID=UPI001783D271|nr:peptidoglycan-binding domain-containing protein [Ensifer sp. ENS05]MBD9591658.1 hypothetical protein [Ensifer sp. ENS05]